jgi:hypothetical protein
MSTLGPRRAHTRTTVARKDLSPCTLPSRLCRPARSVQGPWQPPSIFSQLRNSLPYRRQAGRGWAQAVGQSSTPLRYGIAHTKGQRVVNKRAGRANTLFVAYAPPDEYRVEGERLPWMLLATPGEGVETERWQDVRDRPVWLDYQLCRHNDAGEVRWTWRRTSVEMTQLYAEVGEYLERRRHDQVARTLQRIANQPGFHGVHVQSAALLGFATSRGYDGPLPALFFVQKVVHGKRLLIAQPDTPASDSSSTDG